MLFVFSGRPNGRSLSLIHNAIGALAQYLSNQTYFSLRCMIQQCITQEKYMEVHEFEFCLSHVNIEILALVVILIYFRARLTILLSR